VNRARRDALIALGLMGAAVAGAEAWKPRHRLADTRPQIDLETLFPRTFGGWVIDDRMPVQLVSPDQQAVLDAIYNQVLSRTYVNRGTGERIMLSVAYGGDQSDATRAHRPEVCYPAQGFQVRAGANARVSLGGHEMPVRRLVAQLGGRIEPITFWITVGERITTTGTQQKLAQLAYSARGIVPDGMLVRVSSISADAPAAFRLHERFVAEMRGAVEPALRSQVFGAAA
jgi:EpsI family protein